MLLDTCKKQMFTVVAKTQKCMNRFQEILIRLEYYSIYKTKYEPIKQNSM